MNEHNIFVHANSNDSLTLSSGVRHDEHRKLSSSADLIGNDDYWKVLQDSSHRHDFRSFNDKQEKIDMDIDAKDEDKKDIQAMKNPETENIDNQSDKDMNKNSYEQKDVRARSTINDLEQSMYRSMEGHRPNPNHIVPYNNHPFESKASTHQSGQSQNHDRHLQIQVTSSIKRDDEYEDMRIKVMFEGLDEKKDISNAHLIHFIETAVIPKATEYWSSILRVFPVSGNLIMETSELRNDQYCGDEELSSVPSSHTIIGIPDTDLVIYVSASPSPRFCDADSLALAIACNFDQYDRPTAGAINFCLDHLQVDDTGFATEAFTKEIIGVTIHEIGHILGMSSNSFPFFYDFNTGLPRTNRPVERKGISCVDGSKRSVLVPDETTLQFFTDAYDQKYSAIMTPKTVTVARNHFNCHDLMGVPLENQATTSSCTGDHWKERLFSPAPLKGIESAMISPLTLALLEDSGWYIADYASAQVLTWGHGAGCDFVNGKCLQLTTDGKPEVPDYATGYFCNDTKKRGCSSTHTHKMACSVVDFSLLFPFRPIPSHYQYFPMNPTLGGLEEVDYCPVYESTFGGRDLDELDCRSPDQSSSVNIYGEDRGDSSRCYETSTGEGRCYNTQCSRSEHVLKVELRGEWATCEYDFQTLPIKNIEGVEQGFLTCPRLSSVCPALFCPANCSGRGVCDYDVQVNGIPQPRCKCFDPRDKSPGCSRTVKVDDSSIYIEFTKGRVGNPEVGHIDALISVFSKNIRDWSRRSKLWVSGIAIFVFVMNLCAFATCFPSIFDRKQMSKTDAERKRDDAVRRHVIETMKEEAMRARRNSIRRQRSSIRQQRSSTRIEFQVISTVQDIMENNDETRTRSQSMRNMRRSSKQVSKSAVMRASSPVKMMNAGRRDSQRQSKRDSRRYSLQNSNKQEQEIKNVEIKCPDEDISKKPPPARALSGFLQKQKEQQISMMKQLEQDQKQKQKRMSNFKKRQEQMDIEEMAKDKEKVKGQKDKKLVEKPAFGRRKKQFGIN